MLVSSSAAAAAAAAAPPLPSAEEEPRPPPPPPPLPKEASLCSCSTRTTCQRARASERASRPGEVWGAGGFGARDTVQPLGCPSLFLLLLLLLHLPVALAGWLACVPSTGGSRHGSPASSLPPSPGIWEEAEPKSLCQPRLGHRGLRGERRRRAQQLCEPVRVFGAVGYAFSQGAGSPPL